jgi:transcriptional regulator with XRE-family HTH domain
MEPKDFTLKKLGKNIRNIRLAKEIKQEYLAKKVGLCKSGMSRLENGLRDTTIKKIIQISIVLEVDPSIFFYSSKQISAFVIKSSVPTEAGTLSSL